MLRQAQHDKGTLGLRNDLFRRWTGLET